MGKKGKGKSEKRTTELTDSTSTPGSSKVETTVTKTEDLSTKGGGDAPQSVKKQMEGVSQETTSQQKVQQKKGKQSKKQDAGTTEQQSVETKSERQPQQQVVSESTQKHKPQEQRLKPQQQERQPKQQQHSKQAQKEISLSSSSNTAGQKHPTQKKELAQKSDGSGDFKKAIDKMGKLNFHSAVQSTETKGGKSGRPLLIETNYLELKINNLCQYGYHYDIEFTPEKGPKKIFPIAWEQFRLKHFPRNYPSFDGRKNLFSATKLLESNDAFEDEVTVEIQYERAQTYKIKMNLVNTIDLNVLRDYMQARTAMDRPQSAIQCLDIVFRQAPSLQFVRVGRSFFDRPYGNAIDLGGGMELWHGLFQSAVIGSKPFLNVDVAHKAFPVEQSVLDLIVQLMPSGRDFRPDRRSLNQPLSFDVQKNLIDMLKGLKVKFQLPGKVTSTRILKVVNVVRSADEEKFKKDNGQTVTVTQYFLQEKQCRLQYPHLPCLHLGPANKKNFYPIELCTILPGQVTNKKLKEDQTRIMIRNTATSTYDRKNKIMSSVAKLKLQNCNHLKEFGVQVDSKFTDVNARVLEPPKLLYDRKPVVPSEGKWRAEIFYNAKHIFNWTILNLDRYVKREALEDFGRQVSMAGRSLNMDVDRGKPARTLEFDLRSPTKDLLAYFRNCKENNIELVFVVLPGRATSEAYAKIKQIAELDIGILTQCIKSSTMNRINRSTIGNILLKVNAKLNGVNHILQNPPPIFNDERQGPVMIIGADVTHPSADQKLTPSVAAVASSCDLTATQYNLCWRLQDPKVEIIEDLKQIIIEQLKYFRGKTGKIPKSLIFFRDGVSEGQFVEVKETEIRAIKDACYEISNGKYTPLITFLVVQKRHHTRFFPKNPGDGDRNGNVPPGTCVDTTITFPNKLDFYLCSHASLQGVSRPTRYCVLQNDHGFSYDYLEQMTYYLCHLFTRCTRTVSYPAPTYYAHLAAFRARNYILGQTLNMDDLKGEQSKYQIKGDIINNNPMFFV